MEDNNSILSLPISIIDVIVGPAAIKVQNGCWVGVGSGNKYCHKRRRKAEAAISDAVKLEEVDNNAT